MITKAERKAAEKAARSCYQDVLKVEVEEDPNDESSLLLTITRGVKLPQMRMSRNSATPEIKRVKSPNRGD